MRHFSPHFLVLSSISDFILDLIDDYIKFISGAQSFWYAFNKSYNHDYHLASWFCLEPKDYEVLLAVASMALYM